MKDDEIQKRFHAYRQAETARKYQQVYNHVEGLDHNVAMNQYRIPGYDEFRAGYNEGFAAAMSALKKDKRRVTLTYRDGKPWPEIEEK